MFKISKITYDVINSLNDIKERKMCLKILTDYFNLILSKGNDIGFFSLNALFCY